PPRAADPLARPAANRQALLAAEPRDPLVVDDDPLPAQHRQQAPVPEAWPLRRDRPQACPNLLVAASSPSVAGRGPADPHHPTRPPLRERIALPQRGDGFPPRGGRHEFFRRRSRREFAYSLALMPTST